jgi:hypothetical protein
MKQPINRAWHKWSSLLCLAALAACDPGGNTPITPEEPIGVTLNIVFGSTTGGSPITFAYADPDGPGPQPAMISAPPLRANSVFNTNITVGIIQNGALSDRTGTVRDQDNQYQLFFLVVPPGLIQHRYADTDRDNLPLGLLNRIETGAPGRGTLRVVVRRALNKRFANLGPDNFAQAGGVSDTDATFNVVIE